LETEGAASSLAYLQAALKYEPDYPAALFNTGLVHSQWLKDRDGALKAFSRYLEIVKDPPPNLRTIAENEVAHPQGDRPGVRPPRRQDALHPALRRALRQPPAPRQHHAPGGGRRRDRAHSRLRPRRRRRAKV
jgi:tetratricopeptide (TPR) repeat protein